MVGPDFQGWNLRLDFFRLLVQQFPQPILQCTSENAFAILRAPHQVIVQREGGSSVDSVSVISQQNKFGTVFEYQVSNIFERENRPIRSENLWSHRWR